MHEDQGRDLVASCADGVSESAVREQLQRLLAARAFRQAPRLSRLLGYLVERTLAGEAEALKEYAVGIDVFDRDDSFDPRQDTIVRVQVRRLRTRLDDHYHSEGRYDPVLIEVPTGHYAAVFSSMPAAGGVPSRDRRAGPRVAGAFRLPAARASIIGRNVEIAALTALLRHEEARIVTLSGPGGSGKTRLALEVARKTMDAFPGGIFRVALAPLSDPADVAPLLAQAFGINRTPALPIADTLADHLRHALTEATLLVVDNFEHLLPAAPVLVRMLEATAQLTVLITSREVLHVYGEHEYPVQPLTLPRPSADLEELARNPAVALFVSRARGSAPGFRLTAETGGAVVDVCRRLDGLPLAIELAAARLKVMTITALRDRLATSLDVLSGGPRDVPARQRTLKATIDWSYRLLTEPEQRLFRRLSVCAGGCTGEGAEAVANPRGDLGAEVADALASLVEKSLLRPSGDDDRLEMLDTVRAYGIDKLREDGDEVPTRLAHAAYGTVIAEEGFQATTEALHAAWLQLCDAEHDNMRSALDWLLATRRSEWAVRLTVALIPFWDARELIDEARRRVSAVLELRPGNVASRRWVSAASFSAALATTLGDLETTKATYELCGQLVAACGDQRAEAQLMNAQAMYHRFTGDFALARQYGERALQVCRDLGEEPEVAAALSNLAGIVRREGDLAEARTLLDEARELFVGLDDERGVAWALDHLGDIERDAGRLDDAESLYRDALGRFERIGDAGGAARATADLGLALGDRGEHQLAGELLSEALRTFDGLDHRRGVARTMEGLAELALCEHSFGRALALVGAATAVRRRFPGALRPADETRLDEALTAAWEGCARSEAETWWRTGTRMTYDDAVRFALG